MSFRTATFHADGPLAPRLNTSPVLIPSNSGILHSISESKINMEASFPSLHCAQSLIPVVEAKKEAPTGEYS